MFLDRLVLLPADAVGTAVAGLVTGAVKLASDEL